ncbi:Cullin-domain-containing protein [Coprinopsis marcescibilis]|uniref:Cullin-domain-containing protein n=1 Tax=Coprinopsis marcescibilis TaxID=230819 RepID=A0A5C3L5W8_COPMA|nr:Cullin-domain-containing protein [Coprinopsis marcescibilis]
MATAARRGGRPKIKPPKKHGPDFNVDTTWKALSKNVKEIFNHNAASLSFEENYRYAYNMVLYKEGEKLYKGISKLVSDNLDHLAEEQITPRFITTTNSHPGQQSQEGELLLKGLRDVWDDHVSNMTKLGQLLKYMDRIYTDPAGVPKTWDKGLELFLKHIIRSPIKDNLVAAILHQIQYERDGFVVNRSAIKGCVDVFLWLETDQVTVYKKELEPLFLSESERFYKDESQKLLDSCGAPEYLQRVEARFDAEDSRIHHYLSPQTLAAITRIIGETLLTPNLTTVISKDSGLDVMINLNALDDLSRLYRLSIRVPTGVPTLKRALHDSAIKRGKELNDISLGSGTADVEGEGAKEDEASNKAKGKGKARLPNTALPAVTWVQGVLDLKDRFDRIWTEAFKSDRDIEVSLDEAFESFINQHEKAPEYISLFIDDHLKNGLKGKTDDEVDAILAKAITVFRYITDKDVFERYYKNHLAKRLLHGKSLSDDAERGMLTKLKVESGYQFTSKLEGMFNDIRLSKDTMEAYREYIREHTAPRIDLNVTVMTSTFWPISAPAVACAVPEILEEVCESFESFYFSRHSGRRLTWTMSLGNADLKIGFKAKRHDVNVSTYALIILLLFEDLGDGENDFLTYEEIKTATNIEDRESKRNLQSLACAKYKILKKHPPGRDINDNDSFSFNHEFTAPVQKFKISTVSSKPENAQERTETKDKIEEERRYQIDACVVRIMKDRKTMTHLLLVNEVVSQLSSRFNPDPMTIKRRIENLIEKEYLERCPDRKSYNYVA